MIERLGHYEILGPLGKGAMGEVYRAKDSRLDREIALKLLPAEAARQADMLQRFQHEARVLAALDHPNIVSVHSVEEAEGHHFLTMGLVEGGSLADHIPDGGMTAQKWLEVTRAIGEGLAAAHAKGVIHRDLKPTNVMVNSSGEVKIVDFGLAKRAADGDAQDSLPLTRTGTALGTIPYMSPEQLKGRPVDARSDIFSLGILLYEMASGRRPFVGESSAQVIASILGENPLPPTGPVAENSSIAERVIARCLPKDPDQRYPSVAVLLRELEAEDAGKVSREWVECPALADAPEDPLEPLSLPSRPSLAVLPFTTLSDDPEQQHLATGLWFDLNAELVKLTGLFLLSATTTSVYKGRAIDPHEVGKELGVRHVLEGTVRRAGNRIRLTVQLTETETGQPIWAERYDRDVDDLFALEDEVNTCIVHALNVQLLHGEGTYLSSTEFHCVQAREVFHQAIALVFSSRLEDLYRARRLLDEFEKLEPASWIGPSHYGWTLYQEVAGGFAQDPEATLREAEARADLAIERGDPGGLGYMLKATLLLKRGYHDAAKGAGEVAVQRRPGCPWAYAVLGSLFNYVGEPHRAIEYSGMAFRLTPFVPPLFPAVMATGYYLSKQYERAVTAAQRAIELDADSLDAHLILVASLTAAGRGSEASTAIVAVERIRPDFSLDGFADTQPYRAPEVLDELLADLRCAGL